MGCSFFQKSPKREEQEVPESSIQWVCSLDDLEGIFGSEHDWKLKDLDEFSTTETKKEEREAFGTVPEACFTAEKDFYSNFSKTEKNAAFWDDDDGVEKRGLLNLNLNHQEVLEAWSDRGSLWADNASLSMASYDCYNGEVPLMEEERTRREASVLRYKEKRHTRLFSKKIRYQVRKLNADKRPRIKGRFVKRLF